MEERLGFQIEVRAFGVQLFRGKTETFLFALRKFPQGFELFISYRFQESTLICIKGDIRLLLRFLPQKNGECLAHSVGPALTRLGRHVNFRNEFGNPRYFGECFSNSTFGNIQSRRYFTLIRLARDGARNIREEREHDGFHGTPEIVFIFIALFNYVEKECDDVLRLANSLAPGILALFLYQIRGIKPGWKLRNL